MIDMQIGGGGSGFKVDLVPSPSNLTGSTAGVIYTLNPSVGKVVRLNYLAIPASTGTANNITVKFGTRIVINNATIGSMFSSSGALYSTIGRGWNSIADHLEGLEGEVLTIESSILVSSQLHVSAVVGSYK
ncbi:hypothetical protein S14_164 [Shewanella sp. phage 1/4]|uniref:hypothetical protein n=1 Tax=Shewanella phage 1/4 TaxID=1458859 RepID=UPI0004F5938B|nr:hypothetical protein S14_164 [Shewanella sp. phage 1/4]AHK11273.1 hypothetical protein S14_164 [Shewanella sp. phage 1/4]